MAESTVSGPFRSQNGFQELVDGKWVPVGGGGGGGGNPNDIVVTCEISQSSDWFNVGQGLFAVDLGVTMQTIKDSIASRGKWACFSGFHYTANVESSAVLVASNSYLKSGSFNNVQLLSEVAYCSCGFYLARMHCYYSPSTNSCSSQCFGNYCGLGLPSIPYVIESGQIQTGFAGCCGAPGLSGSSLSCPALLGFCMGNFSTGGGACYPRTKVIITLKFDAFPVAYY